MRGQGMTTTRPLPDAGTGRRQAGSVQRPADEDFDAFYRWCAPMLLRQPHAMSGDLGEAQDCLQEAFERAWQRCTTWPSCPSTRWFIRLSGGGQSVLDHGDAGTDVPVSADYIGDGRTDVGVVRYTEREPDDLVTALLEWFIRSSADGTTTRTVYGEPYDQAIRNSSPRLRDSGGRCPGPRRTAAGMRTAGESLRAASRSPSGSRTG